MNYDDFLPEVLMPRRDATGCLPISTGSPGAFPRDLAFAARPA
jgi:hypothetical protein